MLTLVHPKLQPRSFFASASTYFLVSYPGYVPTLVIHKLLLVGQWQYRSTKPFVDLKPHSLPIIVLALFRSILAFFICPSTWAVQESLDCIVIPRYLIWSENSSYFLSITIDGGLTLNFLDLSNIIAWVLLGLKTNPLAFPHFVILFNAT